jgi:hypothetical protein
MPESSTCQVLRSAAALLWNALRRIDGDKQLKFHMSEHVVVLHVVTLPAT